MGNFNRVTLPAELVGFLDPAGPVVDLQYEEINGTGEVRLFVGVDHLGDRGFLRTDSGKARLIAAAIVDAADRADWEAWRQGDIIAKYLGLGLDELSFREWRDHRDGYAEAMADPREATP